jgi:hypothetical protein
LSDQNSVDVGYKIVLVALALLLLKGVTRLMLRALARKVRRLFRRRVYLPSSRLSETDWREFQRSDRWQRLRQRVIRTYGPICMRCGATDRPIHVDHIKPKSRYPHLALSFENLQVLCETCNLEKSNIDETDYRSRSARWRHVI